MTKAKGSIRSLMMAFFVALGGLLLAAQFVRAQDQCSEETQMAKVLQAVNVNSSSLPASKQLRLTLAGDLIDNLLSLEVDDGPNPAKRVSRLCFYRISMPMYVLNGDAIESTSVQTDYDSVEVAAIDLVSGQVYFLFGFPNPVSGFNNLIKTLRLEVNSAERADDVFDLYLKMVRGPDFRSAVIADDMQLESVALNDFRMRLSHATSRGAFERWWNDVPRKLRQSLRTPLATPVQHEFVVRYFFYDQGTISRNDVRISSNGTVSEDSSVVLFRPR